jgi:hypothetical protein
VRETTMATVPSILRGGGGAMVVSLVCHDGAQRPRPGWPAPKTLRCAP